MVGVLSPQNRGSMLTAMPVLFVLMGVFAGYFSASTYKLMGGQQWKRNTLLTAFLLPGFVFGIVVFLNFFLLVEHSSGAVGFGPMFSLMGLWFGISVPLVFLGSFFGYKRPAPENPLRTNLIPRLIPEQIWYMKPIFSILMGGILPFGVVFIELFFILSSIWLQQFYYLWTFVMLVFFILIVTCAEISIVMCYFQLCSEVGVFMLLLSCRSDCAILGLPLVVARLPHLWRVCVVHVCLLDFLLPHATEHHRLCVDSSLLWL
jgi:transmembrane 9 superfamily member 2/4